MYKIAPSAIHGKGILSEEEILAGRKVGLAFTIKGNTAKPDDDYTRTELGKYTNHSNFPNVKLEPVGTRYYYIAIKNIPKGTELTIDYKTFPWEGKMINKQAQQNLETAEFEKAFADLAYAALSQKDSSLSQYLIGFQLVDSNDENTHAYGGGAAHNSFLGSVAYFIAFEAELHDADIKRVHNYIRAQVAGRGITLPEAA